MLMLLTFSSETMRDWQFSPDSTVEQPTMNVSSNCLLCTICLCLELTGIVVVEERVMTRTVNEHVRRVNDT